MYIRIGSDFPNEKVKQMLTSFRLKQLFAASLIKVVLFSCGAFGSDYESTDRCSDWFKSLSISISEKDCEIRCASAPTDMATFSCPMRCEEFCGSIPPQKVCQVADFWKSRIEGKTVPFRKVNGDEHRRLVIALSQLPKSFKPNSLKAIVKGTRSVDFSAPTSPASSSDEFIILFPTAFASSENLPRIVAHETVHFLLSEKWSKQYLSYRKQFGWDTLGPGQNSRPGHFVQPDGKLSPDEDFANNIEYFLFDPGNLKKVSPEIYRWIQISLGQDLKLERGCHEGK